VRVKNIGTLSFLLISSSSSDFVFLVRNLSSGKKRTLKSKANNTKQRKIRIAVVTPLVITNPSSAISNMI
jgi:hypothetical protein